MTSPSSQRHPSPSDLSLSADQLASNHPRSKSSSVSPISPTTSTTPVSPHKPKGLLSKLNLGAGRRAASTPNVTTSTSSMSNPSSDPTLSSSASFPSLPVAGSTQKIKRKPVARLP